MNKTPRILLKVGGAALDGTRTLDAAVALIANYRRRGYQVIVVHGGGPSINAELTRRGIKWNFINGQRVTTPEMIDVIESVLCGGVNRRLVRYFGAKSLPVMGLSGADQKLLFCQPLSAELGLVGNVQQVNVGWLQSVLNLPENPVPVIAPLGVGANGECYNINADWAACQLAVALKVEQMIFLTDQPGILDEEGQIIPSVGAVGLQNMAEFKVVSGGMLAKTQATLHALRSGVPSVRVTRAEGSGVLAAGTVCRLQQSYRVQEVKEEVHAAI